MANILEPQPELAQFIRTECSKQNWEGIISRIRPNTIFFDAIVTRAMARHIPTLDYYSGGLPIPSKIMSKSMHVPRLGVI
ncbi:hypothetical protein AB3S75_040698 [Citrus x aurantiifolia]